MYWGSTSCTFSGWVRIRAEIRPLMSVSSSDRKIMPMREMVAGEA